MNYQEKKILILGANPETSCVVKKANELGIKTYVTDYDPNAYAKRFASQPCNINAVDVKELEKLIDKEHIDGVVCGVAEALLPAYAQICKDKNMPCFGDSELFSLFVDKAEFKKLCRKYDVPVVDEYMLDSFDEQELKKVVLPVVVKPVDACSSKGISVCKTFDDLQKGIEKALEFSKSKKLLIEKYMTGEEVIVYYAFQDGEASLVAMCDRYTNKEQAGVAQLPTSYIFPSKHLLQYQKETDEKVKKMFKETGVKNGFMFIQSFVDENGKTRFYEPGYRLNGAQEHYIVAETTGVDAKECLINLALTGKEADFNISERANPFMNGKYGCKLSPLVKLGRIDKIIGLDKIASMNNVVSINPSYDDGDEVTGYGTLKQIVCRFFVVADSKEELKKSIDLILETFDVLDENGQSMLLSQFDTNIILKDYV